MLGILVMKEIALTDDHRCVLETILREILGPKRYGVAGG
jgi:hypothetical protein